MSSTPSAFKVPSSNINYDAYRVLNKKTGRKIRLYRQGTRAINPLVKKLLKDNTNNIGEIPKDYVVDRKERRIIRKTTAQGKTGKQFQQLLKNPKNIKYSNKEDLIFDTTTKKYYKKSDVLTNNKTLKKFFKDKGLQFFNNVLVRKYKNPFTQFGNEIVRNNGLIRKRIFEADNPPNTFDAFIKAIKTTRNKVYDVDSPIGNQSVLLKIGSLFRWVPMEWIMTHSGADLEEMLNNWDNYDWGSDTSVQNYDLIQPQYLDKGYFMISTKNFNFGAFREKTKSKYWKCDQPPTKKNTCLEGAINRGLGLNKTAKTLRKEIIKHTNNYIKEGQMIKIEDLPIYEDYFKCRIKVYEDMPHMVIEGNDVEEPNLIRDSEKDYEKLIKILYKDNHISLIVGKKLQISDLSTCEKKMLGIYKKP